MNKIKRILALILCVLVLTSVPLTVYAASSRVIMINNARDLLKFAQNCMLDDYSQGLTVVLAADIDLAGANFDPIPIFSGNFHGNGYKITGLEIKQNGSYQGFFRILTAEAEITKLHLEAHVSAGGTSCDIGGIAGVNYGKIVDCTFHGTLSGNERVGGIVGSNALTGIIENSSAYGNVSGAHFTGGIAGQNTGVIRSCTNYAAVNTTVEQNNVNFQEITLDSLTGTEAAITVTDIGGIVGTGTGVLRDCANYGNVGYPQIGYNIGGIAGSYSGYIVNCTNHASIHGRKEIGGIVGQLEPAVNINYAQDTVQSLQAQMNQMSSSVESAGGHIQNGSDALSIFSGQLSEEVKNAQDALSLLSPDPNNPQMPDMDSLEAARAALGSSLSSISSALSSLLNSGMSSFGGLTQDIQNMTGQMTQIGSIVSNASDSLGASIADVSDADTDADFSAKLDNCVNLGTVSGEWNVGGIAGAIAPENDLDPESDLQIIGNSSLNFDISLRAVVTNCENSATVTGKKQNTGGITGWASMGLMKSCINTGLVDASNTTYVGGIAGQSLGYIRNCNAKCTILGNSYVGGIAGVGATVTDCRGIVYLENCTEQYGAVLGVMKDAQLKNNYYLCTDQDPGAVDGISYSGKAQALDDTAFFALDQLPGAFRLVILTFVFNDGSVEKVSLPYGNALASIGFPVIPASYGEEAHWDGPFGLYDSVTRDATYHIVSNAHINTLASSLLSEEGFPQFLLQGQFRTDAVITANTIDKGNYAAAWSLILPESSDVMQLRCRLPAGCSGTDTLVEVRLADSSWVTAEAQQQGSYLVISLSQSITGLRLYHVQQSILPYVIIAVTAFILLAAAIVTVVILRKRKK